MLVLTVCVSAFAEDVNPYPREALMLDKCHEWSFDGSTQGWGNVHDCTLRPGPSVLAVTSASGDPYFHSGPIPAGIDGPLIARLRLKSQSDGPGKFFWATQQSPQWSEKQSVSFEIIHDGQWHEYDVRLDMQGTLARLRIDPSTAAGEAEFDWIELYPFQWHPLEIESLQSTQRSIKLHLRNHSAEPMAVSCDGRSFNLAAETAEEIVIAAEGTASFESRTVEVRATDLPPLQRRVCVVRPDVKADWVVLRSGRLTLQVTRDGSLARLLDGENLLALLAPLVNHEGVVPNLKVRETEKQLRFEGDGTTLTLAIDGDELHIVIESESICEGPVVRVPGELEQGLFAGIEYLGKGERSSSKLDIETPDHLRFAPDPLKVTMPLMACRTPKGTVAVTWNDMALQPVFATPNFLDGPAGHRMALRGKRIEAIVRVQATSLESAIEWAVQRRGLPPLPKAPRDRDAQWELCLAALNGPLKNEQGWGHCAEPKWGRQPFADMASTIFRLTGQVPDLPRLVPGGAHIRNESAYFLSGRAAEWLRLWQRRAGNLTTQQKSDGSYRYRGQYLRGHFEDTSSGLCGLRAVELLEFARRTGDERARQAGVKTLDYMKRFRTPRGAQVWELSLHTPDIMASAHLVRAYVLGFEITGNREYLTLARKWALTGLPFVYQWSQYPTMAYATVPVYGATNWRAPNWIGLPVQWCGLVYADALTRLAPLDKSFDWLQLAEGILIAGEQMQYPEGDLIGCLPDIFSLPPQQRAGPSINPGALVSLRLTLSGELAGLAVAEDGSHRVVSPFPVVLRNGKAHVDARPGVSYQIVVDGSQIIDVRSKGADVVTLD